MGKEGELSLSRQLFKQLRKSLGVLGRFGKARAFVMLSEDENVFSHLRIGNGRSKLLRRLRWRFAQTAMRQSLQHP